ncbi:MAG: 50S rRNA methyltransferase [Halobacteriovorax sp.]|nr:50S rRNA methyltransferase [Halobacteriovorax sp.]|tara:strand:+ start:437029 stop:437622 length:594 start_codon:yes stop_codon:yes gene_type:complete
MSFKVKDHYFKKAKQENYLARSIYKLKEINEKFKIISKGMNVLDLGYFPGSWIQYTCEVIGEKGKVVGIDIKPVNKKLTGIKNVTLLESDYLDFSDWKSLVPDGKFDVVLSDMAPNTTGIKDVDQARSLGLVEKIIYELPVFLKPNGSLVFKIFDSNDAQNEIRNLRKIFKQVKIFRPDSTRSVSKEIFVVAKNYEA